MIRLILLTPWDEVLTIPGDLSTAIKVPGVIKDYPIQDGEWCRDITVQPVVNIMPSPNLFCVEIVRTESNAALIRTDSRFQILSDEVV